MTSAVRGLVLAGHRCRDAATQSPVAAGGPPELLPVANRPILVHVLERLRDAGVTEVVVVADRRSGEPIRDAVGDGSALGLALDHVEQLDWFGTGHAIQAAAPMLGDATVVLHPGAGLSDRPLADTLRSFEASGADALVTLDRKGVSCLGPSVVEALGGLLPSWRGELELSAALAAVSEAGGRVELAPEDGWWACEGDPLQLLSLNRTVLEGLPVRHWTPNGSADVRVEGRVAVDPQAVLQGTVVRGPAVIGAGARLSDAYIGPYTAIGDGARVEGAEIEDSIVMAGAGVFHLSSRLSGCVLGPEARLLRSFALPRASRVWIGAGTEVALA
jgi:glucose-1-phosphate thymidylyltransferase